MLGNVDLGLTDFRYKMWSKRRKASSKRDVLTREDIRDHVTLCSGGIARGPMDT